MHRVCCDGLKLNLERVKLSEGTGVGSRLFYPHFLFTVPFRTSKLLGAVSSNNIEALEQHRASTF
jgi:hypothetical protein